MANSTDKLGQVIIKWFDVLHEAVFGERVLLEEHVVTNCWRHLWNGLKRFRATWPVFLQRPGEFCPRSTCFCPENILCCRETQRHPPLCRQHHPGERVCLACPRFSPQEEVVQPDCSVNSTAAPFADENNTPIVFTQRPKWPISL